MGGCDTGWTFYTPYSAHSPSAVVPTVFGIFILGWSTIATGVNFIVTVHTMRARGITWFRMPLFVWAIYGTSVIQTLATPVLAISLCLVGIDNWFDWGLFDPARGGDPVLYQHLFWFYSHPAVYIMILPGFGIISEIIAVKARKPIFGYRMMAFSLLAIVVLGFTVWAHHMFTSGMPAWLRDPMMITTAIIAVPTGVKVFSWLATLWRGVLHMDTPMLWAMGFITMFVLGGISGVMLAMVPFDLHVSKTYFIVAHIHYVLFGGSVFTIFAGIYYWFPKMTGRMYDERLGRWHFWTTVIFFNLTFAPMHIIGIQGMPRRVADYALQFATWNLLISFASWALGLSTMIFVYNMVVSWRGGPRAVANPWRGLTLEWQVSSPPPIFNFDSLPTIVGGPYEYGVPGAVHAVFRDGADVPAPASTRAMAAKE
jgi:cytochrome c oxidase subunit 1